MYIQVMPATVHGPMPTYGTHLTRDVCTSARAGWLEREPQGQNGHTGGGEEGGGGIYEWREGRKGGEAIIETSRACDKERERRA